MVAVAVHSSTRIGIEKCLEPFFIWMKLIGLTPRKGWMASVVRWTSFASVLAVQSCLVGHIFFNAESVAGSYTQKNPSKTISWGFLIDALNFAVVTIGSHGALLFLVRPDVWQHLTDSFNHLVIVQSPEIHAKCTKMSTIAVIYIVLSVSHLILLMAEIRMII